MTSSDSESETRLLRLQQSKENDYEIVDNARSLSGTKVVKSVRLNLENSKESKPSGSRDNSKDRNTIFNKIKPEDVTIKSTNKLSSNELKHEKADSSSPSK